MKSPGAQRWSQVLHAKKVAPVLRSYRTRLRWPTCPSTTVAMMAAAQVPPSWLRYCLPGSTDVL